MSNLLPSQPKRPPRPHRLKLVVVSVGALFLALVLLILFLGLVPLPTRDLTSEPHPVASYDEAVARFQEVEAAEAGIVNDQSGSHLLDHGERTERVYVLVHGITNSPLQWVELGETLYDRGHNVLIVRMPYHGLQSHHVRELRQLTAADLRAYADEAVDMAAGLGDEIVVAGISGGGAVAAWMVQNRPEVDRALLLAPFFGIEVVPPSVSTLLMNAFARLPNIVLDNPTEPQRDWVYRGESTRGVAAFLALGQTVMRAAAAGEAPVGRVIVLTTAIDDTASNVSTAQVVAGWRSAGADVTTYEFEPAQGIPHNSVDPAADAVKKRLVYDRMLDLLGESP